MPRAFRSVAIVIAALALATACGGATDSVEASAAEPVDAGARICRAASPDGGAWECAPPGCPSPDGCNYCRCDADSGSFRCTLIACGP